MTERLLQRLPRGRAGEVLAVAGAYVVTAGYLLTRAIDVRSYIWLIDEFLYTKGALGYAGGALGGHVYGEPESVHAPLYSWLLAPIYGFLNSEHAFKAAHAVDALVFAAVLIPIYLTARYLGARPLMAMLAALLGTWVPWTAATLVLMSESLAYLAFAWAVWAMVRAIAEPSPGRDVTALALIAATAYTRPQFTLLFAVFVLAVGLYEFGVGDGPLRAPLRPHWLLGAASLLALIVVAVAGRSLLGGYSQTAGLPRFPPGLWQNMVSHAAHIVVGAGILPPLLWLGWVLRTATGKADRRHYAFAVLSALLVVFVFYEVGFFSQNVVGGRIQERTAFYPVALFALGVAAASTDLALRGPRLRYLAAGVALALVIGATAFAPEEAAGAFESFVNPAASYNKELHDIVGFISKFVPGRDLPTAEGLALVAIVLGAAATVLLAPRVRQLGLPLAAAATLLFCAVETNTVLGRNLTGINTAIPNTLGGPNAPRAWVDGALFSSDGDAAAVESPLVNTDSYTVWLWVEFWNKKITRLYVPPGKTPYSDLPALSLALDKKTGAFRARLEQTYLVVAANDPRFAFQGTVVKRGPFGLNIIKPVRPYRASWAAAGNKLAIYRPVGSQADADAPVTVHAAGRTVHATVPAGAQRVLVR